jgi:hypothetical protein
MARIITQTTEIAARFWHSVEAHVVGNVPPDLELCEFDCRKPRCSIGDWAACQRRIDFASEIAKAARREGAESVPQM